MRLAASYDDLEELSLDLDRGFLEELLEEYAVECECDGHSRSWD